MTAVPAAATRTRSPLVAAGAVTALLTVAAAVLAAIRPWGDTGVTAGGTFDDATPVPTLVLLAVAAVAALGAVVVRATARRSARPVTVGVVVLGVVAVVSTSAVTTAQVFPRDGGWWGVVSSVGAVATGLLLLAADVARPTGPRGRWTVSVVALVVPLALVVTAGVVAPGWAGHVVDGTYPDRFAESPGPATVTRIGWRADFGPDAATAVLGGRLVVVDDTDDGGGTCRLRVRALDLGTGDAVWSSARTTRCNGPAVTAVDGNNTVVRVVLRGPREGDRAYRGAPTTLYLGTVDGRDVTPSASLDAVRWWTEGFGLVVADDTVRGLDPRTGVTTWSREIPRCDDGSAATLQVPAAPADGVRLQARSPYDSPGGVAGTQQVAGTGRDVVLALRCGTSPRVWVVDAIGSADDDRVATLPVAGADGAPTTFLPWLDTVVAVVPTEVDRGAVAAATLVGVTLASGSVAWIRPVGRPSTATVSPSDGAVTVVAIAGGSADAPRPTVLDVHDGTVRATGEQTSPFASVALTGARLDLVLGRVAVTSPDVAPRAVEVPDCTADTEDGSAAMLAGPGGVVVRCTGDGGAGAVGLVP